MKIDYGGKMVSLSHKNYDNSMSFLSHTNSLWYHHIFISPYHQLVMKQNVL